MPLSFNDLKYQQRSLSGRNALDDYQKDREYWISQGGSPGLSLGDMIRTLIGNTYPNMSIQDAVNQTMRIPFNAVTINGDPLTINGEFLIITGV